LTQATALAFPSAPRERIEHAQVVDCADLPRTHEALTSLLRGDVARFRGRVATYDIERAGLGFLIAAYDALATPASWELVKALGRCQATLHADTRSMLEEVAAGRSLLAYNVLGAYAEAFARSKPQLGVIYPSDYTLVASRVAFIARRAPNLPGARAWLDHLLSPQGQQLLEDAGGFFGVRTDAPVPRPVSGLGRMLSVRSWVELGKSLGKFAIVGGAGALVLWLNMNELMGLGGEPINAAIGHAMSITGQALIALTCALVVIAGIDVPFQLWQYHREMKMTREEIRQEHRESEGAPEVRGRIRAMQREMAERRMMEDVPRADVIVVNPTHYAVALRYDDKAMRAPRVVAKGVDLMAARIREVASEHRVPIFEAPPLARALHRSVEIGDEIPAELYAAVAQVLTYVFQLRAAQRDHHSLPAPPVIDMPKA